MPYYDCRLAPERCKCESLVLILGDRIPQLGDRPDLGFPFAYAKATHQESAAFA